MRQLVQWSLAAALGAALALACGRGALEHGGKKYSGRGTFYTTADGGIAACDQGFGNCDGESANGCETRLDDVPNCGACGQDCLGGSCVAGRCSFALFVKGEKNPRALTADGERVFWVTIGNNGGWSRLGGVASQAHRAGEKVQRIAESQAAPRGIALSGGYVYWVNLDPGEDFGELVRAPRGGGPFEVVSSEPTPVAVAASGAGLFWLSMGLVSASYRDGAILRLSPADGSRQVVASGLSFPGGPQLQDLVGIAADDERVYWPEGTAIRSAPVGGGTPFTIATASRQPLAVAVDARWVYWTDWDAGTVSRAPKSGGPPVTLADNQTYPMSLAVDGSYVWWCNTHRDDPKHPHGEVMRVPIGGGPAELVAGDQSFPAGIAVDAAGAYWSNAEGEIRGVAR